MMKIQFQAASLAALAALALTATAGPTPQPHPDDCTPPPNAATCTVHTVAFAGPNASWSNISSTSGASAHDILCEPCKPCSEKIQFVYTGTLGGYFQWPNGQLDHDGGGFSIIVPLETDCDADYSEARFLDLVPHSFYHLYCPCNS